MRVQCGDPARIPRFQPWEDFQQLQVTSTSTSPCCACRMHLDANGKPHVNVSGFPSKYCIVSPICGHGVETETRAKFSMLGSGRLRELKVGLCRVGVLRRRPPGSSRGFQSFHSPSPAEI